MFANLETTFFTKPYDRIEFFTRLKKSTIVYVTINIAQNKYCNDHHTFHGIIVDFLPLRDNICLISFASFSFLNLRIVKNKQAASPRWRQVSTTAEQGDKGSKSVCIFTAFLK